MTKADGRAACSLEKRAQIRETKRLTALRRKHQVCRVFECKIVEKRLSKKQQEQLKMLFVEGKWFYNHILSLHQAGTKLADINTTNIKSVKHQTKDKTWLESKLKTFGSQHKRGILKQLVANEKAITTLVKRGFQTHGSFKFKSELTCVPLPQYGVTYKFKSARKVKIAGISGSVLLRTGEQLQIADELANANLVKKADGYYLKVTAFINRENFKEKPKNGKEIGLDFGIKTNITTSEGEKLDVLVEESDRLKKLQKEMFRRTKGSNNRFKTIKLINREHLKLSNKKEDKANKIVSKLKSYDCIVMQDEQIANWHKGWFGKQVQHSCLGRVKAKLKALPQTIVLDKWIPTTKWCPRCMSKHDVSLAERTYTCSCGYQEDRDIHSAKNMLAVKDLVFSCLNQSVPTEHREVTLTEFKTAIGEAMLSNKSGQRSEKITPFKV